MIKVYTPGVWDILHFGHINVLETAKQYGDYLIVGVCSDKTTKLHGKNLIVNENERKKIISSLKPVDEVIIYDNPDQIEQLKNIQIFVIGEEFGNQNVPEHQIALEYCKNNNINIIRIPRSPNISSTQIKEKISKEQKIKQFWESRANLLLENKVDLFESTSFTKDINRKNKDLEFIIKAIKKCSLNENLLDLGCGVGRITLELSSYFKNIYANDYVNDFIEIAKQKAPENIKFTCCDAEDFLPLNYDCCLISGLFLHLTDDKVQKLSQKLNNIPYIILKESLGTLSRYDLPEDHYSKELKTNYIASYRTLSEILNIFNNHILKYTEIIERHRKETHLQVILLENKNNNYQPQN